MGRMSELQIEREGAMNMTTNIELAQELKNRLEAEFGQIEDHDEAMQAHILLSELGSYIAKEKERGK